MPKVLMSGKAAKAAENGNGAPPAAATEKKKRNSNPGVRQQGGRIYDSENGTTCHQCRQKTIEVKAKCQSCTFHFCPRCLENRYSEVVAVVNALPGWACPRCRGLCNCSNCRKKAGLEATGILANVAKTAGFGSVSELLRKNPKAQALNMMCKGEAAAGTAAAGGSPGEPPKATPKRPPLPRPKRKAADEDLVDEADLGARPAPMPAAQPLALHKDAHAGRGAGAGAKRQRGPAWLDKFPATSPLPADVDASELACILEFVAVFGAPALGLRGASLPAVAAELVHPAAERRACQLCPIPEDSTVAALHRRLLEVVRQAWGVQGEVGLSAWQPLMRAYYAAALMPPEAHKALREEHQQHQPPAVAGELFVRPPEGSDTEEAGGGSYAGCSEWAARCGVAAAASGVEYPEGGYWGLTPGLRVSMLYALVHDALDVHTVRSVIEEGMGGAAAGNKERRSELADVRRAAKEAAAKQRDHEIALIIAGGAAKAMTLEEQREVMGAARVKAESAASAAAAAKVSSLTGAVHPPTVRVAPLGQDREGLLVYVLQAAPTLTGRGKGLVVMRGSDKAAGRAASALPDAAAVARALDPRGRREGPLRHAIAAACKLPSSALRTTAIGGAASAGTAPPAAATAAVQEGDGASKKGRPPDVEELTPASPLPSRMQKARQASEAATPKVAAVQRVGRRGLVASSPE